MPTGSGYSTEEANAVLHLVPESTWERTGSTEQDFNLRRAVVAGALGRGR